MRRSQRTDACVSGPGQQKQSAAPDNSKELSAAWKSLSQTKAALRHIENRLEASPGSGGVLLHSVVDTKKTSSGSTRKPGHREGRRTDDSSQMGGASKPRGRGRGSPEKSSSRSPLRNTTQESNVRKTSIVEFREPLASYREATPPPLSSSQFEAYALQSLPDPSHPPSSSSSLLHPPRSVSNPLLSLLIYQRDTRDRQTELDQNSLLSSALDSTEVRYLNDRPALEALRTSSRPAGHYGEAGRPNAPAPGQASPTAGPATAASALASSETRAPGCVGLSGDTSASSSPGSASQKLENLRRRQPDDKLEKLKERIRKQRENLEGAAERDKLQGRLEQPILPQPHPAPSKIQRKVAPAPPAPIYRGFNPSETKIRTPDGKVWREEDFHNLSRDVYRDLSRQLAESTRTSRQQQQPPRERRPTKPVRKVCKAGSGTGTGTDPQHRPVISTSSWRDGQKLVKMLLGPVPRMHQEERAQSAEGPDRTGAPPQRPSSISSSPPRPELPQRPSSSPPRPELPQRPSSSPPRPELPQRPSSSPPRPELPQQPQSRGRSPTAPPSQPRPATSSTDLLSADIRCILDDLQLERGGGERGRGRRGGSVGSRAPLSAWGPVLRPSRSASPSKRQPQPRRERHYNADTVRLYIAKQQEERKRRLAEERMAQREEAERRSQRLQELYRKQRGGGAGRGGGGGPSSSDPEGFVLPVQSRLQETYTKLTDPHSTTALQQQHPMYQPSGESDKENKRQAPQSPSSSSDMSLSAAPLSRTELGGVEGASSLLHPAGCPIPTSSMMPPTEQLLSQLLGLQAGASRARRDPPPPASSRSSHQAASPRHRSRLSRIEALKATAASLSSRIESEARKLASGPASSMLEPQAPQPATTPRGEEGLWAPPLSPPVRETSSSSDHLARRIQRILNSAGGQSSYDAAALPGVEDLLGFKGHREKTTTTSKPRPDEGGGRLTNGVNRMEGWERRYGEEEEEEGGRTAGGHDSSGGSISEGPLLSEDSLSEGERSPPPHRPHPHRTAHTGRTRPAVRLGAVDYCEAQGGAHSLGELSLFQREAERYPPLSPTYLNTHWDRSSSKAPWEELAKGSPISVINIFTRNLRAADDRPEWSSPPVRSVQSAVSPGDDDDAAAAAYEDDFVSLRSSGGSGQSKKGCSGCSVNSHYEELMRRSPYESKAAETHPSSAETHPSSAGSTSLPSHHSSLRSPGSTPNSAPPSRSSNGRRGLVESERSDSTVIEEHHSPCSPPSETLSAVSRKSCAHGRAKSACSDSPPGGASGHSPRSLTSDSKKSSGCSPSQQSGSPPGPASPSKAQDSDSSLGLDGQAQCLGPGGSPAKTRGRPIPAHTACSTAPSNRVDAMTTAELQFAPAVLHQRLSAELSYLDSIEESVRQLGDVERIRGVSLAQQETVSLAQILKAQKQRHERDLTELKIKAEREALEAQLEMEESRQRAARAHLEAQQSMVQAQQKSLGELHEATFHLINQQTIREMKELSVSQTSGPAPYDQQRHHHGSSAKQPHSRTYTHSSRTEASDSRSRPEEGLSSLGSASLSDSMPSRRLDMGGGDSSSHHSPPGQRKRRRKEERKERHSRAEQRGGGSSVEEEVQSAIDDSLPSDRVSSVLEDQDTEYSMKFDESLTEDELEERSFRSLLPSEAHRRGTLENRPRPHQGSDHETTIHDKRSSSRTHDSSKLQDSSLVFSSGQNSFSRFTMDMVRQYMQDEEVRAHHQSSLLLLRQKALKEKTRAQLAWLEHQKKRLRDKGEDDKMPPIRKKQRGLLMKLQQEQAEIKRLQEASRAARKERQMLLKQQEEIQRMRHSTLRLKERLKSAAAEEMPLDSPVSETPEVSEAISPSAGPPSPSPPRSPPLSVSGSETSSIMEKLKKMRSHTDEKFLTKREQHLLQRRQQAEELLQWKQRLDQEEAEVHRMEKALSGWDRPKAHSSQAGDRSEVNLSSSSQHPVQSAGPRDLPAQASPGSEVITESSVHTAPPSNQGSPASYSQDFSSYPRSLLPPRASPSPSQPVGGSITTQLHSASLTLTPGQDTHTEAMSEPSDIEGRIGALKEELRLRRAVVYQLKKEQKKRHKERLKAQEASLLKQLESYNVFIQKTKGELKKQPDVAQAARTQIKTPSSGSADKSGSKRSPTNRADSSRSSVQVEGGVKRRRSPADPDELSPSGHSRSTSLPEEISDEDPPTVTPTPVQVSPEHPGALGGLLSPEPPSRTGSREAPSLSSLAQPRGTESGDRSHVSSLRSEVLEEVEEEGHSDSERLPRLDQGERPASQQNRSESEPSSGTIRPHSAAEQEGASPRETVSMETPRAASEHQEPSFPLDSRRDTRPLKDPDSSAASTGGGYQDDFDSSIDSSPRGDTQRASPTHPENKGASSRSRSPLYHSQEEEEESSERSGTTSHHSDSLFDLQSRPKVSPPGHSQEKSLIQSNHSPTLSPSRTTPPPLPDHMPGFSVGDRVLVSNVQPGTLRFKGQTQFANGFWAGVELDKSEGSNNGAYDDVVYFECPEHHGIFAPPDKISHLPEKFEMEAETTGDEDSFFDDLSPRDTERRDNQTRDKPPSNQGQGRHLDNQTTPKEKTLTGSHGRIPNGRNVILELEDVPTSLLISDKERIDQQKEKVISSSDLQQEKSPAVLHEDTTYPGEERDTEKLSAFADKLLNNFVKDAVKHFTQLRKAKEEKIAMDNQRTEGLFPDGEKEEEREKILIGRQKDGVPFFLDAEQEEASSPELCNQPESPVLGARGQEELAKRLAELELSRGLLDQLGDEEEEQEQDWFDEDYGLSSRRQQQKLQQKQKEEEEVEKGGVQLTAPGEGLQDKIPPRPELPLPQPPKLPEQPAMVVPHTASEVEKLVHAATQEIWESCGLGQGDAAAGTLVGVPLPKPSQAYLLGRCAASSDPPDLGKETCGDVQEAVCNRSYRQAVFDLTWELLQEIYGDDPGSQHPQWVKPRRANSSYSHRVRTPAGADLSMVQAYVTSEVLKLYRLKKDSNQKSDWQKMLKFGRKKRDRVDHILVQELHEEEAQWVDYDEDELFVKQQLADSIFEALLKDTADAFTHIHNARAATRTLLS